MRVDLRTRRVSVTLYAVPFVAALLLAACGNEDTAVEPDGPPPFRLAGDWFNRRGETWDMYGWRFTADSATYTLGVDWRDGTVAVVTAPGDGRRWQWVGEDLTILPVRPWGAIDTLQYRFTGDSLTMWSYGRPEWPSLFLPVTVGSKVQEPFDFTFSYAFDTLQWTTPPVWAGLPAHAQIMTDSDGSLALYGNGDLVFVAHLRGFHGPGTYALSLPGNHTSYASFFDPAQWDGNQHTIMTYQTRDDGRSSVTVTGFDEIAGTVSAHFDVVVYHTSTGAATHATGVLVGVLP